jgi:outer membrane receptor protein involved in Fe transport
LNAQVDPLINSTFNVVNGAPQIGCAGPGSICSSPAQGGFSLREAYAELLVPILQDMPFAQRLTLSLGDRYSHYSNFGSTNNWKAAIEYKPIEDLLLRATASKVFRAPSPTNLFAGPSADAPTAIDPCTNISSATNKSCPAVAPPSNNVSQITGYVMGSQFANQHGLSHAVLQPEHGTSFDYGFVYDPHWIPGLTLNADYYRITLTNLIVSGPGIAQTILNTCFSSQGTSPLCSTIFRNIDGTIKFVTEAPFNSGNLVDQGLDFGARYRVPETPWGNFVVGLNTTYIQKWNVAQPGFTQHLAAHFDKTYGNFARVRALATLDWNMGPFVANWTTRYFGPIKVGYVNSGLGPSGLATSGSGAYIPNPIGPVLHFGAMTYHNASFGYNIEPLNTFVQVGIDNIFDKQPPVMFQNNVLNADTDVNTYDTVGRYYHASVTVKF